GAGRCLAAAGAPAGVHAHTDQLVGIDHHAAAAAAAAAARVRRRPGRGGRFVPGLSFCDDLARTVKAEEADVDDTAAAAAAAAVAVRVAAAAAIGWRAPSMATAQGIVVRREARDAFAFLTPGRRGSAVVGGLIEGRVAADPIRGATPRACARDVEVAA